MSYSSLAPKAALCCRRPADRRHAEVLGTGRCHRFGVIRGIRAGDQGLWNSRGQQRLFQLTFWDFEERLCIETMRWGDIGDVCMRECVCVYVCVCVCEAGCPWQVSCWKAPLTFALCGLSARACLSSRSHSNGEKQNCLILFWQIRTIHNLFSLGKCGADRQRHSMEIVFGVETVQSWECTRTQRQGLCLFLNRESLILSFLICKVIILNELCT